jgi:mevalonate kinase
VFSQENHRVFRIREDGLLRKNEDYPAPEIVHGRDLLYQKRIEKLEKEKEMREIVEEKKRAQDELLDGIVSVKSRLERLLQDENVQSLAKTMNLEGLLK